VHFFKAIPRNEMPVQWRKYAAYITREEATPERQHGSPCWRACRSIEQRCNWWRSHPPRGARYDER